MTENRSSTSLTPDQVALYNRDGFIVLDPVFDELELDTVDRGEVGVEELPVAVPVVEHVEFAQTPN